MRMTAATIAMVFGLVPVGGSWLPGADGRGTTHAEQRAQATEVIVLKVEGMT